ncbi:hypothetical protein IAR50_001190 [Cryptococcus sp. DSM 104548]
MDGTLVDPEFGGLFLAWGRERNPKKDRLYPELTRPLVTGRDLFDIIETVWSCLAADLHGDELKVAEQERLLVLEQKRIEEERANIERRTADLERRTREYEAQLAKSQEMQM